MNHTENEIANERQRLADADGGANARLLDEIEAVSAEEEAARTAILDKDRVRREIDVKARENTQAIEQFKGLLGSKAAEVEKNESTLRNLNNSGGQWTAAYPLNMQKLINAIETERRFRNTPVGPIGRHIKLLRPEWSSAIERSLGSTLEAFIVTSKEDQSLLTDLMRRNNWYVTSYANQPYQHAKIF